MDIILYLLKHSSDCFSVPLLYITVAHLLCSFPTVSHVSLNMLLPMHLEALSDCKKRLWKFPCSHSLPQLQRQEPHQVGSDISYCSVGFCLPSLLVCGHPTQLTYRYATVHLPRSKYKENFSAAKKENDSCSIQKQRHCDDLFLFHKEIFMQCRVVTVSMRCFTCISPVSTPVFHHTISPQVSAGLRRSFLSPGPSPLGCIIMHISIHHSS